MSDAAATPVSTPAKGRKGLIIGLIAALLLAGGGGGAWWFLGRGAQDEAAAAAKADEKRKAARVFVTLENFVVNLADRDSERYAQIGVVLEVEGKDVEAKITAKMPAVRNELLLLISSKLAGELTTREGKEQLATEIALAAARPLGWAPPSEHDARPTPEVSPKIKVKDAKAGDPPADKGKAKGSDKASDKGADKAKAPEPVPNPVALVHFASFIVQ